MSRLNNGNNFVAQVRLDDAVNLSKVGSSFGARTKREARKRSGLYATPVPIVGSNPEYFGRKAQGVFRSAVTADEDLSRLYLSGWARSQTLEQTLFHPRVGGPSVQSAAEMLAITEEIQAKLDGMDLRVELSGKKLDCAQDIAAFALSVITSDEVAREQQFAENRGEVRGTLYAGISPEADVNRADYWVDLQQTLHPQTAVVNQ
jgi:hypothetical protein